MLAGYGLAWFITSLMGATLHGFQIVPMAVVADVDCDPDSAEAGFFPSTAEPRPASTRSVIIIREPVCERLHQPKRQMDQLDIPPDSALVSKYVPQKGTPAPDHFYFDCGWSRFYRRLQRA
jgi:hypothetical protein